MEHKEAPFSNMTAQPSVYSGMLGQTMERGVFVLYGKVIGACLAGIEGSLIEVEVNLSSGLPQMTIVGLPDSAVRESVERVRAAIKNCGFRFPMERITVNLAPADVRKEGASFDLAIALGIIATSGQLASEGMEKCLVAGELALDGSLRPIPGVLSMVDAAKSNGLTHVLIPHHNVPEAQLIDGIAVIGLRHLNELKAFSEAGILYAANHLNEAGHLNVEESMNKGGAAAGLELTEDYVDVRGQHHAKRALLAAATGMHNIIVVGPPGSGKTMLIRRLSSILPSLTDQEALEVTKIYSVAGAIKDRNQFIRVRPFRSPHHTISTGGLIGAGSIPKPGEISLAHKGVLFLDELPEFPRYVLEAMRQPLEDRRVTISRAKAVFTFPAHFILAASMNPCPCGFWGSDSDSTSCTCSPLKIQNYRARLSGPLLDRIDMHVEVPRVDRKTLTDSQQGLSSTAMRQSMEVALERQKQRYKHSNIRFNGELSGRLLREVCSIPPDAEQLLLQSFDLLGLSVRAHDRILKMARTLADLGDSDRIQAEHIAEAIQYRSLDKKWL
jgi:magnesium chelatase family protein